MSSDDTNNVTPYRRRHVSETMIANWFNPDSSLTKEERAYVVRHLLTRCKRCTEIAFRIGTQIGILLPEDNDTIKLLGVEPPDVGTRRLLGLAQWAILRSVKDNVANFINAHSAFHHLGLYERLIEVAKLEMRRDPFRAYEAANLAIVVAHTLKLPTDELRNDYLATATATMGNAARLCANFTGAEMAFKAARALRENGTDDPLVDGLLYRLEGAYLAELGRYDEAEVSLSRALIEYSHAGDTHLEGRTLLSLADTAVYYDCLKASGYLGRANALIDPVREPILEFCSRHIEICCLVETNRPEVALDLLEESRDLYTQWGRHDMWVRVRGYWIEGRIAFGMAHYQEAESILSIAFETLDSEGRHPVDLTLIAVDLLQAIAAQEKRQADVIVFADRLLSLLKGIGLHDQGRAVMLLLRDALLRKTLDGVEWKIVKTYYRRNWYSPLPEPMRPFIK